MSSDVRRSSGSSNSVRAARRNAPGSRQDIGWKHGKQINDNYKHIQCDYCGKLIRGGITRFKHHLAGTRIDASACPSVPDEVKQQMKKICQDIMETTVKKSNYGLGVEDCDEGDDEVVADDGRSNVSSSSKRKKATQTTINHMFKTDEREDACRQIARFFYTSAIPFNCAKNPEFVKMCKLVCEYGKGFKPPSYHEIREKYLKQEVSRTNEYVETHKENWKLTGCTITSDGWTDKKKRSICNFLVNSPTGTVFLSSADTSDIAKSADKVCEMLEKIVDEVGEENVVQVVTDNAANYKLAGAKLMEKRPTIFWTPCAAHCIDLMLEDFEKKFEVHKVTISKGRKITNFIYGRSMLISMWKKFSKGKDLIRPGATRFATSYLTLGCLHGLKVHLLAFFSSSSWKSSRFAKLKDGKSVEVVVLDNSFWDDITICLKAAFPLIRVLRLVDSDEKPSMPFIYDAMLKCKEKIAKNLPRRYEPIHEIIDSRWENQLSRPLHYAAYSLNPQFRYRSDFKTDIEIKRGLYDCLLKMAPDRELLKKIDEQLDIFHNKKGLFGIPQALITWETKDPASWWIAFGDGAPDLKRIAIRILSLTCTSSGCERNWSAFEMVHTKKRNRLHQQKMNDLVYVMCNTKLETKQTRKQIEVEDMDSDDEWIVHTNGNDGCSSSVGDLHIDGENIEGDDFSCEENYLDDGIGFQFDDHYQNDECLEALVEEADEDATNYNEF